MIVIIVNNMIPAYTLPIAAFSPTPGVATGVSVPVEATVQMPSVSVMQALAAQPTHYFSRNASDSRTSPLAPRGQPESVSSGVFSLGIYPETPAPTLRYSSAFLAQMLSQVSPSEASSLAAFYANDNRTPSTLDQRLMEAYSMVKYLPSLAAKPIPEPPAIAALPAASGGISAAKAVFQRAAQAAAISMPPADAVKRSANDNVSPPAADNDAEPTLAPFNRPFASLIKEKGVRAYQASFVRNQANALKDEASPV